MLALFSTVSAFSTSVLVVVTTLSSEACTDSFGSTCFGDGASEIVFSAAESEPGLLSTCFVASVLTSFVTSVLISSFGGSGTSGAASVLTSFAVSLLISFGASVLTSWAASLLICSFDGSTISGASVLTSFVT